MVEKMCPSLLKNSTACLLDNKKKRCFTCSVTCVWYSAITFTKTDIFSLHWKPGKRNQAFLKFLLDDWQTDSTEPLFQFLSADSLRVWTASYQTQHLEKKVQKINSAKRAKLKMQVSLSYLYQKTHFRYRNKIDNANWFYGLEMWDIQNVHLYHNCSLKASD